MKPYSYFQMIKGIKHLNRNYSNRIDEFNRWIQYVEYPISLAKAWAEWKKEILAKQKEAVLEAFALYVQIKIEQIFTRSRA